MVQVLYKTLGEYWDVVQRPRSRTLSSLGGDEGAQGNGDEGNDEGNGDEQGNRVEQGDDPDDDPSDQPCLEDDYVDAEADLATYLGVNIVVQPVVPARDSQIPPDTLDYNPQGDGKIQHEEVMPDDPKPESPMNTGKVPNTPAEVVDVDSDSQITPTELELTPQPTAPTSSSTPAVEIVESQVPAKVDTMKTSGTKEDLKSVQNRIAQLKQLD